MPENKFKPSITIKVIIGKDDDSYKEFVCKCIYKYKINPNQIFLMPKGYTPNEVHESFKYVIQLANTLNCNISSRLHIIHNFI